MKIAKRNSSSEQIVNRFIVKVENESLWEELEMARSKNATKGEKSYKLEDVISGEVHRTTTTY